MVILLPRKDNFKQFEGSLDYQLVDSLIKALDYQRVNLTMPKFEFESGFSLSDTLAAMGMPVAFSASADFSGMTGNLELFIQEAIHKAFVSVDEAGYFVFIVADDSQFCQHIRLDVRDFGLYSMSNA